VFSIPESKVKVNLINIHEVIFHPKKRKKLKYLENAKMQTVMVPKQASLFSN